MLIILNGSESINKTHLARMMLSAFLSPYEVEGYQVKFRGTLYEIYDSTGELVFRPSGHEEPPCNKMLLHEDTQINQEASAIQDQVEAHAIMLFRDGVGFENYLDNFIQLETDAGLWEGAEEEWKTFATDKRLYQKLIAAYKNSAYGVFVATGSFSKTIIEQIKTDVGESNVTVVNIVRNPSVSFCLHQRPADYYANNPTASEIKDFQKIHEVTINAHTVYGIPDVVNVHYEDIIKNKKFNVLDKVVEVEGIEAYNDHITTYEKTFLDEFPAHNHKFTLPENPDFYPDSLVVDLAGWNTMKSHFHSAKAPGSPFNVFQDMGYTPLTEEQIMQK